MDKTVHIKNLTDKLVLTVAGKDGIHLIGLGADGTVQVAPVEMTSDNFSDLPPGIVVPLLRLTKCSQGGLMLSSHNKDVTCFVNKERLTSEINLLGGSTIEVAEKKLRVFIGPMARERRLLPSTPGVAVSKMPPPKPTRKGGNTTLPKEKSEDKCDWFQVHHPTLDEELLEQSTSPKQLGDLAASFLTKQIHMYTDSRLSAKLTDQIFKFLQEVAEFQRDILMDYVKEITQHLDEMPEAERDKPMHTPSIKLLVELLRQIMDPMSHVVLCLQLLRKFSHFPQNLTVMMKCQAAAAVMGCMAVYLNQQEVQLNSLDILAKITAYQYGLNEKVQIRETGLEMILRAMQHHDDHEHILQSGCRTLANLTTTLQTILDSWLNIPYNHNPEVEEGISRYENLLKHIFTNASAVVQKILQGNADNFGIRTEGRRFLFNLSKMSQILTKAEKRKRVLEDDDDEEENQERTSEELIQPSVLATKGILKQGDKSSELRKVHFVDEFTFTMSTCSTVSTCSDLGSDGEEDLDLVRRKDSGGAVIQITESRKMTKSEIENLQEISTELECQSIIQSTMDSHSEVDDEVDITQHDSGSELENSEEVQPLVENSELDEFSDSRNQSYLKGGLKDELDGPNFMEGPENGYRDSPERQELKKEDTQKEKIFCEQDDSSQRTEFEHSGSELRIVEERKSYEFPNSFTVSDVEVLNNVIRLKIIEYVSCLVYDGDDKQALKDIDLPLLDLLEKSKALPELIKFVQQQYNPSKTLLDIDTSYLIGIVDAVRYTSLLPDLIRKALLDVVQGMTKNKDQLVVYTSVESVKSVYLQETLISAVTDETFLSTLQSHVKIGEDDTGLLGDLQSLVRDNQNCSLC